MLIIEKNPSHILHGSISDVKFPLDFNFSICLSTSEKFNIVQAFINIIKIV